MLVAFPSIRGLDDDDIAMLALVFRAASHEAANEGRAAAAGLFVGIAAGLRAEGRVEEMELEALPELDERDLDAIVAGAGRQEERQVAAGRLNRGAFFADLRRALDDERERRRNVLAAIGAAMDWYDRSWPGA